MRSLRILAFLALAVASSAETRSYHAFRYAQGSIAAPMPGGGLAIGVSGQDDGSVVVLDPQGKVTAARSLGAWLPAFLTTSATGEIFFGHLKGQSLDSDRVTKLGRDLSPVWSRRLVALDRERLRIKSGAATRDRGVVLTGDIGAASFVVKLDAQGAVAWTTVLDLSGNERLLAVRETADGYVVAGAGRGGAWLVRLRRDGELVWQRTYPPMRQFDALAVNARGEIVAAGDAAGKPAFAKIGPDGAPLWGKVTNARGYGRALVETGAGLAAVVSTGMSELALLALTDDGALLWQRKVAGEPMVLGGRNHFMLAMRRDRLAFTTAFNTDRVPVLDVDPATGSSDCRWLASGTLALEDAKQLRAEEPSVEVSAPGMVAEPAHPGLTPLAIAAAAEGCPALKVAAELTLSSPLSSPETAFVSRDDAVAKQTTALLEAKDVAGLEALAVRLLGERSRDPLRPNFEYYAFHNTLELGQLPEEQRLAVLRRWVAERPQSSAAKVALAGVLYDAAWERRGNGYVSTVTAKGAAEYEKLLDEAGAMLESAGEAGHRNPKYWQLRISLAAQGSGEDVRDLARRALAIHADPELARRAASYLLPKWGGSEEELISFADEASRLLRAQYGDAVYAWLAYQFRVTDTGQPYAFDWERVQKGYAETFQRWPQWVPAYHQLAAMARQLDDQAVAKKLFGRDELAWYADAHRIWADRVAHESAREWALAKEEPPFVPNVAAPIVPPPPRPASPLKKIFDTPVFLKVGQKRIEAKIVGMDRGGSGRVWLSIGLREKLDAHTKAEGLEVIDGAGKVVAVIERRTDDFAQGMAEVLTAVPTDAAGVLP